jgi:hypothetical protein
MPDAARRKGTGGTNHGSWTNGRSCDTMPGMRRLLLALAFVVAPFATIAMPTPASALCGPDEGCSPCGGELVIQGKNTRIEWHQC